jgi:hypothetical protein
MKTQLPSLILIMILGLFATDVNSQPVQPVCKLDVMYTAGQMFIDGYPDEISYCAEQSTYIFNPTGYDNIDSDFKAVLKLTMDQNYLYLWADIEDDIEEDYQWGLANPELFDNVEVFIQLDTCTVPDTYNSRTIQLRFCRGLDSVQEPGRARRNEYVYYCQNTQFGWVLETAIPWTSVLTEGDNPILEEHYFGPYIGFDVIVNDSDNSDGDSLTGNHDTQSAWDSDLPDDANDRTEDGAWKYPSVFGRIRFMTTCKSYSGHGLSPECTELDENTGSADVLITPNPASETICISGLKSSSKIIIINSLGIKVSIIERASSEKPITISALKSGLYTAVINGRETIRFVKE